MAPGAGGGRPGAGEGGGGGGVGGGVGGGGRGGGGDGGGGGGDGGVSGGGGGGGDGQVDVFVLHPEAPEEPAAPHWPLFWAGQLVAMRALLHALRLLMA